MLVVGKTSSVALPEGDPAIRPYSLAGDEQQPAPGAARPNAFAGRDDGVILRQAPNSAIGNQRFQDPCESSAFENAR
jgi:hypothetical protein